MISVFYKFIRKIIKFFFKLIFYFFALLYVQAILTYSIALIPIPPCHMIEKLLNDNNNSNDFKPKVLLSVCKVRDIAANGIAYTAGAQVGFLYCLVDGYRNEACNF